MSGDEYMFNKTSIAASFVRMLALSLIAAPIEDPVPVGDAGPMLDREALRQYRERLAALDEELDDAEARHDVEGHAKRSTERDALLKEIARATGLGDKPRRTGSPTEKARLNVTRTIRHAVTYLSTALPELAAHLDESVTTRVVKQGDLTFDRPDPKRKEWNLLRDGKPIASLHKAGGVGAIVKAGGSITARCSGSCFPNGRCTSSPRPSMARVNMCWSRTGGWGG